MGYDVRVLLRPATVSPALPTGISMDVALCSMRDERGIRAAMVDVDAVIHLAGGLWREDEFEPYIHGSKVLADAAGQAGVKRLVLLSHLGADAMSAYPALRAKALAERFVKRSQTPFTIVRSSLVFGEQDQFTTSIARLLSLAPGFLPMPGNGETLLQPIWVEDLATALVWTLEDEATLDGTYEIGGPEFIPFREVVKMVMQRTRLRRVLIPFRQPYLRFGARLLGRFFHNPPITPVWLDYLAVDRTADLYTLPRVFQVRPARMEGKLDYLEGRHWLKDFRLQQRRRS